MYIGTITTRGGRVSNGPTLTSCAWSDVVLEVHCPSSLGPILFDYRQFWMDFELNGIRIRLHGMVNSGLDAITSMSLKHHTSTQEPSQLLHPSISFEANFTNPTSFLAATVDESTPSSFVDQLQTLLTRYEDNFSPPTGLPPIQKFDHQVPLLPNATQ